MSKRGQLVIYSGPSGVGKGTLLGPLLATEPGLVLSVSATTRAPREGEVDGVHYHFICREEFERLIAGGEMLEYTEYNGNYYGTPKKFVEQRLDAGYHVVLEIEVDGAMQVHRLCPDALMIFVMPPSFEELRHRLVTRGTESPEQCAGRLAAAVREISFAAQYDFIVINDEIETARQQLLCAIGAGKMLSRIQKNKIEEVLYHAQTCHD
ncbi:guanylate kinase [Yanshouia hominis]|uniref:Guanylate kinase n=1 Tax=Yanshouia hominis TaxID=2763673 RepID=A0ABR7NG90_9FIRM|nr:guanylate kinase [Yanshouia hominis]MBC8575422.1 guanylate kinase [Yanshouia hominis]